MRQETQRVIRVFVSSTFQDMHDEREQLVKFTFPELRRRCRERAVEFVEVDLRWGVPDEEKAEGKVLPICLAEIERCRPYFIGLLGERYGYVPEKIDEELSQYTWSSVKQGCSGKVSPGIRNFKFKREQENLKTDFFYRLVT